MALQGCPPGCKIHLVNTNDTNQSNKMPKKSLQETTSNTNHCHKKNEKNPPRNITTNTPQKNTNGKKWSETGVPLVKKHGFFLVHTTQIVCVKRRGVSGCKCMNVCIGKGQC
jgi:hypothetical protein